jgi:hypothetical protein
MEKERIKRNKENTTERKNRIEGKNSCSVKGAKSSADRKS